MTYLDYEMAVLPWLF